MGKRIIEKNIETILKILFKRFNLKYRDSIYLKMQGHPHYPSLTALQFILYNEGIETLSLKSNFDQLKDQLPKPALVHVTTNTDLFLLVNRVDDENVYLLNELGKEEQETIPSFLKMWDGTTMIFNLENITPKKVQLHEKVRDWLNMAKRPLVIVTFLFVIGYLIISQLHNRNILNYLFLLGSTLGLVFSSLLQVEGIDEQNPIVKKICTSGSKKNYNCSSILNSKDAYFLKIILWSDIGFVFFCVTFLFNLILPNNATTSATIILSLSAFPYVFYSIAYQKYVAKSWCRLCLGVQLAIFIQFVISIYHIKHLQITHLIAVPNLTCLLLVVFAVISALALLKPLIKGYYELRNIKPKFNWLKHNSNIQQYLFSIQNKVSTSENCALICGNPEARTTITLVVSPVCSPCMNELNDLLPMLIRKKETKIEFLFLTEKEEIAPEEYSLAVKLIGCYLDESGRFLENMFTYTEGYPASKYSALLLPHGDGQKARKIFKEQIKWCINNKIYSTPKIYINGAELSSLYSANDIDYMCS